MNFLERFWDSASGLLVGRDESHETTSARAEKLLLKMQKGEVDATKEIHTRHGDKTWEFHGVIVFHDGEFELRDPGEHWRDSGKMHLDVAASCTLSMPLEEKKQVQY